MAELNIKLPKNLRSFNIFLAKIKKKYASMGVEVGVVKNATGVIKRGSKKGQPKNITIAEEAFYNCMGVPEMNIPARDYQTKTVNENKAKWSKYAKKALKTHSTAQVVKALGISAKDDTKAVIANFGTPENSYVTVHGGWIRNKISGKPVYIEGKGKNQPLVDNGDLLRSITYQVIGKDGKKK
jgi:hypothetical protein